MPLKIIAVHPESLAAKNGIMSGDLIISINDHAINDFLDLQFYGADELLRIKIKSFANEEREVVIRQDWETPLGLEPVPHRCRNCANKCIFCFIDQMRPDIRKSLYIKDDDFRLSFVYGNFITLTNLSQKDFTKIIEQQLSPLYVSVHTTNPSLHKKLMRYQRDFDILKSLEFLKRNGIELHTQIVLVPGWNDGKELEKTLSDLTSTQIDALSVGIVPVGLTRYRSSLTPIRRINSQQAKEILNVARLYPRTYCSDEIFLLAGEPLPKVEYYADFPQLENGIGMLRLLLENWEDNKARFINYLQQNHSNFVFLTGELAYETIKSISACINEELPRKTRVQKIINNFLGNTITVAGLLAAEDIFQQTNLLPNEIPVIPGNLLNTDGLTIDNIHLSAICRHYQKDVIIVQEEFENWERVKFPG